MKTGNLAVPDRELPPDNDRLAGDRVVAQFDRDMAGIYDQARAIGYNATRFLAMVHEHGGLETAHRLIASSEISYGFAELWMRGRLDLTVESLVLRPEYQPLFTSIELNIARARLGETRRGSR